MSSDASLFTGPSSRQYPVAVQMLEAIQTAWGI